MKSGSNGVTRIPIHLQPLTGSGPSNQQEPIVTKTSPNISPKQAIDSNIHNKTHTKGNGVYDKNSPSPSSASSRSSLAACQCRLHWQPRQLTRRLHQSSPTSQQPPGPYPTTATHGRTQAGGFTAWRGVEARHKTGQTRRHQKKEVEDHIHNYTCCGKENHRAYSCKYGMPIQCYSCQYEGHKLKFCDYLWQ